MKSNIIKKLTDNLGIKILAVICATILWLIVYNIDDPNKTKLFTTNVVVKNASVLEDMGKCYEVLDNTNTVTFSVTAKRSIIDKLDDSDFSAVADMSNLVQNPENSTATVPIDITSSKNNSSLKYSTKKNLLISLDDLMTKQFVITANTTGEVAEGYALSEVKVTNPNVLKVSGPANIVGTIATVVANVDVGGMSVNISDNVVPILYDKDGKEIDTTKLKLSNDTVVIEATILGTKEVPINFQTSGTPASDYQVVSVTADSEKVRVKGAANALNSFTGIDIPEGVLDISGIEEDLVTTVDITEYLPEGITLVNSGDGTVTITVKIEAYTSTNYSVTTSNLTVNGLGKDQELTFVNKSISVNISGMQSDLDALDAKDIKGTIDVSGLGVGTHQVTVNLTLDSEKYKVATIKTEITISAKDTGSSGGTSSGSGSGTGTAGDGAGDTTETSGTPETGKPEDVEDESEEGA